MSEEKKPIEDSEITAVPTSEATPEASTTELTDADLEKVSGGFMQVSF